MNKVILIFLFLTIDSALCIEDQREGVISDLRLLNENINRFDKVVKEINKDIKKGQEINYNSYIDQLDSILLSASDELSSNNSHKADQQKNSTTITEKNNSPIDQLDSTLSSDSAEFSGNNSLITPREKADQQKNSTKNNEFYLDLRSYEEGDIANEFGEKLVIRQLVGIEDTGSNDFGKELILWELWNNKNVISGLYSNPKGKLEIKELNLESRFIVKIISKISSYSMEFIMRTEDDDVDNDIKVLVKGGYVTFVNANRIVKNNAPSIIYKEGQINEFIIHAHGDSLGGRVEFSINGVGFLGGRLGSFFGREFGRLRDGTIYNKLIIKYLEPSDYLYHISIRGR